MTTMTNPSPARDQSSDFMRTLSNLVGYGTIVLTLLLLFFFLVLPVGLIVVKAFYNGDEFTLEYFRLLFDNDLQTRSIVNSLWIGVITTIVTTMVALPLALINARFDYFGKTLLSGLILVPMVMPPFVGAIGVSRFFARGGSVNQWLDQIGLVDLRDPIDWLGPENAFWAVIILEVLHLYPIMYLNLSAALANIDPSLEEMASTLGVSRWRQLKDIVWPLSRPGYFAGAMIVFIWALTDIGTPLLVGFEDSMPVKIFTMVTDINENPVGFAMVFLVIALTIVIFLASKFFFGSQKYEMMAKGHVTSPHKKTKLLGTAVIYTIILSVVGLALIPHLSVLIASLADKWFMTPLPESYHLAYYGQIFQDPDTLSGIKNSIFYSTLSTSLDIVLGSLIAYVIVRKLVPLHNLLDSLVMVPLALPGIVIAFGYVVTYSGTFLDPVNNPTALLVIAYAIRRLPYMVRSAAAGLQQTSESLEEASATFGASRFYTLRKIVVPLVTANLVAGSLLCFAYAMLDVSDSLILAMTQRFYPMTKVIYAIFDKPGDGPYLASALGVVSIFILAGCILGASVILGKKMGELFRS